MVRGTVRAGKVLTAYSTTLVRCLVIGRLLAWLVAAVAGLHGSCLVFSGFPTRREPTRT